MHMGLTEMMYFKILHKAEEKANYLRDIYGSWKTVATEVGGVSFSTWARIGCNSPYGFPYISTLAVVARAEGSKRIPKRLIFASDMCKLKRMCKSKLVALKKEYGFSGLIEKLRVSELCLNAWLNQNDVLTIPEFHYLLAIDSLFVLKEEDNGRNNA